MPSAYVAAQRQAPERLQIEVTSVRQKKASEDEEVKTIGVTVQARVLAVRRTATGLKAGALITIYYTVPQFKVEGAVIENVPPVLSKGAQCPAYLRQYVGKPAVYDLAAGEYSFEKVRSLASVQRGGRG